MFYKFNQNNSFGKFDIDDVMGIGPIVYVEANDANSANYRAESLGIYFNGVDDGIDCPCCGDRWYNVTDIDYNVTDDVDAHIDPKYDFGWHDTVYVHMLDGAIRRIKKN